MRRVAESEMANGSDGGPSRLESPRPPNGSSDAIANGSSTAVALVTGTLVAVNRPVGTGAAAVGKANGSSTAAAARGVAGTANGSSATAAGSGTVEKGSA